MKKYILSFILLIAFNSLSAQTNLIHTKKESNAYENLLHVFFSTEYKNKQKANIAAALNLSNEENELFYYYLKQFKTADYLQLNSMIIKNEISIKEAEDFINSRTKNYIEKYNSFLLVKEKVINSQKPTLITSIDSCGFEDKTFDGWVACWGNQHFNNPALNPPNPYAIDPCMNAGVSTLNVLVSQNYYDSGIQDSAIYNALGNKVSLYFDGADNLGCATRVKYTFSLTPSNPYFIYHYACTASSTGHPDTADIPYFRVRLYDSNNIIVSAESFVINEYSQGLSGVYPTTYKPWTTDTISLLGTYTIEFTLADCVPGGHWNIAYIDYDCPAVFTTDITNLKNNTLKIYPNPANNVLHIESKQILKQVTIQDLLGKTVYETKNASTIDVSSLPNGIFFINTLIENENTYRQKIIIEK